MNSVTTAPFHLSESAGNPEAGPPVTVVLLVVAVIAIVMIGGAVSSGLDAYRLAFAAIGALFSGAFRLALIALLLVFLLVIAVLSGADESNQAPGTGTPPSEAVVPSAGR